MPALVHLCGVAMRMQAQALRIEARAKERLADEYDAAQERGEVATHGGADRGNQHANVADRNVATAADLGLRRDQIHEARRIRDAERVDPGAIDRSIEGALARGEAPTRTQLRRDLRVYRDDAPQDEAQRGRMCHPPMGDVA